MNNAPIFIVNEDDDDKDFFETAWKELEFKNPLKFFKDADEVLDHLRNNKEVPFLIICDLYLHKTSGLELKKKILEDSSINYKSIPFVFFSDTATQSLVEKSFDVGSNGFFIKGKNMREIKETLTDIVRYWQKSKTPEQ